MTRAEYVDRLLELGRSCGDVPIYGSTEWETLDQADPRRFAATVAAAEAWRTEGTRDAIRARLQTELDEADLYVRWRVRMAGLDVHAALTDQPA